VLVGFRYGYADNLSNWTDKADPESWNIEGCGIDISWAVDENRQHVDLDFIDFVRVYTGLNQKCPAPNWWGETSTEVRGAEDLHLEKSLTAIQNALTGIHDLSRDQTSSEAYDLQGRKISLTSPLTSKILIRNGKKYFIK
jgi:predicted phosphohydrolase